MAATKKSVPRRKSKVKASDVTVGNRTLEAVLMDLAERSARAEERSAKADERSTKARARLAESNRGISVALSTLAEVALDLRRMSHEMNAADARAKRA
jgi:hypothetical protein